MGDEIGRTNPASKSRATYRGQWTGRAAVVWAVVFAVPHVWWALGVPAGFPGGEAGFAEALTVSWFVAYDLLVVALCAGAALVAWAAMRRQPVGIAMAWGIGGLLLARGVAGLLVDGFTDPVWSPMFVIGGLLFGTTAWQCARSALCLRRGSGAGADAAGI